MEAGRLGVGEFAFPGPLRDQLVAAIVDGTKTTTTALLDDFERDGEPLPRPAGHEGHATVAERRAGHAACWPSAEMRAYVGDPSFTADDDTVAVAIEFRVVAGEDRGLAALPRQARAAAGAR